MSRKIKSLLLQTKQHQNVFTAWMKAKPKVTLRIQDNREDNSAQAVKNGLRCGGTKRSQVPL